MRKVYGIGEALLDIIFKDDQPIGAVAGGSTLNAIVSLGRMQHEVYLVSETGNDRIGDTIDHFLTANGVSDQYLFRRNGTRSPVALAFLNEKNDAEYEIFKDYSGQSLNEAIPPFKENDLIMFGSFFSLNPSVRSQLVRYLKAARDKGAILVYDPNYRKHHSHKTNGLIKVIEENFSLAHIVRGSNEDFHNIFGLKEESEMAAKVREFCPNVIVTANSKGVFLNTDTLQQWYPTPAISPVSTIGAGDNFNAGLVHGILTSGVNLDGLPQLNQAQWQKIIASGIAFATNVCQSLDNYVSKDYLSMVKTDQQQIEKLFQSGNI